MRTALLITAKDVRERVRDRSAFIWAFLAPVGLALIFSLLFGDFGTGAVTFDYGVVDEDGSDIAAVFTRQVLVAVESGGVITVDAFDDRAAVRTEVEEGRLDAAFVVPAGFGDEVRAGRGAIDVLGGADATIGTQVARSIAASFAERLTAGQLAAGLVATVDGLGVDPAAVAQDVMSTPLPVSLGRVDAADKELDVRTYLAAGMGVFFLFFTVQFGVTGLLEERRLGTMPRLLAAPISRAALYGGKILTSFLLGITSLAALAVTTGLLMGADWGNPVGSAALIVAGVAAASAIMAVVATFARTAEQAATWQAVIAVVLGLLGGTFFPVAQGPGLLARLSLLTPHQWFLRGLGDLTGTGELSSVLPAVGAMLAFAVVGFGLAAIRVVGGEQR